MTPLPPVPNTALVRVIMDLDGSLDYHMAENIHHVQWASGAAAGGDMVALAENFFAFYSGLFSGSYTGGTHYISSDLTLAQVTATDLTSDTAAFGVSTQAPVPGAASQVWVANTAFLFSQQVSRRFRGGHGRTYLPGVTPDNTTDGRTWTSGCVTDLQGWWTENFGPEVLAGGYASYPNISGLSHVLVSYVDRAVNPTPPYRRPTPLTDVIVKTVADSVIRSQRRRVRLTPTPS